MSGTFNRIPKQCAGICELEQEYVDKNRVVLTRNCRGPRPSEGEASSTVTVREGEVVGIDKTKRLVSGKVACRNAGLIEWLSTKEKSFEEMGENTDSTIEGTEAYCQYVPLVGDLHPTYKADIEARLATNPCRFTQTGVCGLARVIIEATTGQQGAAE